MAKRRYELDTRVLTVFVCVAMPFVAFGSFMVVSMARGLLQQSLGTSLEQRAVETQLLLERYVGDQIVHLHMLAMDPQVRATVSAKGRDTEIRAAEQAWTAGSDAKLNAAILESPLAQRLREAARIRPGVKLLQVVDTSGRLVASSSHAGRLDQSGLPWFDALPHFATNTRAYFVSDIQRAGSSSVAFFEVGYPIYEAANGNRLGAVRAIVDASDLYSVLAPVRIGRTGRAVLVRSTDGTVLASDDTAKILTETFVGFATLQTAIAERRGYRVLPEVVRTDDKKQVQTEPGRLVGYSPVEQVPNVQWLVVVQQDLAEAMAPVDGVTRYLWWHFIAAFATVILLAFYFSFKLDKPVIEDALHLHEEHVPGGKPVTEQP